MLLHAKRARMHRIDPDCFGVGLRRQSEAAYTAAEARDETNITPLIMEAAKRWRPTEG